MISLKNPLQHAAHPIARRIPWTIWKHEFDYQADAREFGAMDLDFDTFLQRVNRWYQPYNALLCMLLGHQEASPAELLPTLLNIDKKHLYVLLKALLVTGRTDLLERYITHPDVKIAPQTLQRFWTRACIISAKYGNLSFMQFLAQRVTPEQWQRMIAANDFAVYIEAAANGQMAFLHYLENYPYPVNRCVAVLVQNSRAFREALSNGHTEIVIHLDSLMSPAFRNIVLAADGFGALLKAAANGHTATLEYAERWMTEERIMAMVQTNRFEAYRKAAANGHADTLRYLERRMSSEDINTAIRENHFEAYREAAAKGCVDILQYLESHMTKKQRIAAVVAGYYQAYRQAAINGHVATMQYLEPRMPYGRKHAALRANQYKVVRAAVKRGDVSTLEQLQTGLEDSIWKEALSANGYEIYGMAAEQGDMVTLQYLEGCMGAAQRSIAISMFNPEGLGCTPYIRAIRNGHIEMVQHLESLMTPQQVLEALKNSTFNPYYLAISCGHLHILKHLESNILKEATRLFISAGSWLAYRKALCGNNTAIVEHLETYMTDAEIKMILRASNYKLYEEVMRSGCLSNLKHIEKHLFKAETQTVLRNQNCHNYALAISHGTVQILKYFESEGFITREEIRQVLPKYDYGVFRNVVSRGDIEVAEYLSGFMSHEEIRNVFQREQFQEWGTAICREHFEILAFLEGFMSLDDMKQILQNDNYRIVIDAVTKGNIDLFQHLFEIMPSGFLEAALQADNYAAYRNALKLWKIDVLPYLEFYMPRRQIYRAIFADYYLTYSCVMGTPESAYYVERQLKKWRHPEIPDRIIANIYVDAAANGRTSILRHLERSMTPEFLNTVLRCLCGIDDFQVVFNDCPADNFRLTQCAQKHPDTLWHLLNHPIFMDWALLHQAECGDVLSVFLYERCESWHAEAVAFAKSNPDSVFTLDEANTAFALRAAIALTRHNSPASQQLLRFLLRIPSVRAQAHTMLLNEENALLRTAIRHQNQGAIQLLMAIPQVHDLAQAHNYYADDVTGDVDIRAIALDRESSLRALSPLEQLRFSRLKEHYAHTAFLSTDHLLEELRDYLRTRYEAKPARITLHGKDLVLPLTWDAFQQLGLSGEARASALRAYYAHDVHTALRWILKPNPWMAANASFAEGEPEAGLGYAPFEGYSKEIVLLWAAATDEKAEPTQGHTLKGRINHFIAELALINRAHNWDKIRPAKRRDGREVKEYYDDQKGDNPSCYSGCLRRLFQSIIGHPLLRALGTELLDEELREFARGYFASRITPDNLKQLGEIKQVLVDMHALNEQQRELLRGLDISEQEFNAFIEKLSEKYKMEWKPVHVAYLKERIALKESAAYHVTRLWSLVDFPRLLESQKISATATASTSGFFAATSGTASSSVPVSDDRAKRDRPDEDYEEQDSDQDQALKRSRLS
ncbi:ankyrin repeat domain-containing protein [Legionella moravica]|uniref:Ankyrin repeat protein n=2 Tax=Legionella moravica TaxID=39962 RepID=A0A378JVW9_9GAMM|nr:ankyrin repeat domain-containing protein [Legionella moravica]STX61209.1 ankyrin repeat protein [Legionella moravica]